MGWSLSSESITHFYDELYNCLEICGKAGLLDSVGDVVEVDIDEMTAALEC